MIDVIATFAVFASAISVNKLILKSLPPLMFVGIRMGVAGLILLGYYSRQAGSRLSWHKVRTHIIYLIPIALASTYISSALKAYGLRHLLSSKVALIGSLDPFITALYGYVLWGQRFAWQHICGMCLGVLGVGGMLAVTRYNEMADQWWIFSHAEVAALLSIAITRLGWIGVQKYVRDNTFAPAEINTVLMLVGSIFSLVTAYIFGEFAALPQETSWRLWGLMGYTVIVGNIIAYTGYGRLLKRQSVTLVSLSGLLIPLFAHLYGPILTGEPISPYFFAALACVGSGLWLFNQRSLKSEQ